MAHFFFRAEGVEKNTRLPIFKPYVPPFASPGCQPIALLLSLLLPLESIFLNPGLPRKKGQIFSFLKFKFDFEF